MDTINRALCCSLRDPPVGVKKVPYKTIIDEGMVKKMDGTIPTQGAIAAAAKAFKQPKDLCTCVIEVFGHVHPSCDITQLRCWCSQCYTRTEDVRGRPSGNRKTSTAEDRGLMQVFRKLRPAGHYVDARIVHANLARSVKNKISKRTVTRRLAERGYTPTQKVSKSDPGPALAKKRVAFARRYEHLTPDAWADELHAVADLKDFTWYPRVLRAKFNQLRARWTYMKKTERMKPAFARPKRWFKKKDYKQTRMSQN